MRLSLLIISLAVAAPDLGAAVFRAAPVGTGSAFAPFQAWLRSPAGQPILRSQPNLRWFTQINLQSPAGLAAIAPLVERLPSQTLTQTASIAELSPEAQSQVFSVLDRARMEAAPAVETEILAAVAELKTKPDWEGSENARSLEEQIKTFSFYSDAVRQSYKGLRRRNTERAMRSAQRDARELLRSFPLDEAVLAGGRTAGEKISRPLLPRQLLVAPQFYDPAHWSQSLIPDRSYARALTAAAGLMEATDRASKSEQSLTLIAKDNLAATMRAKDAKIHSHMMRVGLLAGLIAWEMGFPDSTISRVAWGARIHDIGKIDEDIRTVVNKEGKLTAEERAVMERHPTAGAKLIESDQGLDSVSRRLGVSAALNHHETYDGKGYPNAIPGEDIPLVARITSVADYYDALMENRPYRKGMTSAEALAIMEKSSVKFDAQVWRAFRRIVE